MRKFKLIKKYPGSPSLGTIATQSSSKETIEFKSTKGELKFAGSDTKDYFNKMVSSQPEFWEEIINVSMLKKIKDPLFITEDGVSIYHPDKFWIYRSKENWLFETDTSDNINYFYHTDPEYTKKTGIYYFSTKEAAEKYIIMNTPCLSIKDLIENSETLYEPVCLTRKDLISLVKTKMNEDKH